MTVLVLLAAAAGAGVVTAHFLLHPDGLLRLTRRGTRGRLRLCALRVGAAWSRIGVVLLGAITAHVGAALGDGLTHFRGGLTFLVGRLLDGDLATHEDGDRLAVHRLDHRLEQVVSLEFVDQQRVFVLVAGVLNGLTEVVHVAKMFLPRLVDGEQCDGLLEGLDVELRDDGVVELGRKHTLGWYGIWGTGIIEDKNIVKALTV